MEKKCLKPFTLLLILCASVSSCKFKPGKTQPPKKMTLTIFQPCHGVYKTDFSGKEVSFRTKIFEKVQDANQAIVNYLPQPIVTTDQLGSNQFSFPVFKDYSIDEPTAYSMYLIQAFVETKECGFPMPNSSNNGTAEWEANSNLLPVPSNITLHSADFQIVIIEGC